jgi:hypothetical protein
MKLAEAFTLMLPPTVSVPEGPIFQNRLFAAVELEVTAHGHGAVVMNGGLAVDVYAGRDLKASPGAYDKLTAIVIEVEVAINYIRMRIRSKRRLYPGLSY